MEMLPTFQRRPLPWLTVLIFLVCFGGMAWLRLGPHGDKVMTITYGVPLLVCLWYPEKRLLWALTGAYAALAGVKLWVAPPAWLNEHPFQLWGFQMLNMGVMAITVHLVIDLTGKLRAKKAKLEASNQELIAREEEISRQNEELQAQAEELSHQNEEIQQQAEELQAQAEELQCAADEARKRQAILQALMESTNLRHTEDLPERICRLFMPLLGPSVAAVAIMRRQGDELILLAQTGAEENSERRWPLAGSFAGLVIQENRTAFIADLRLRPDLTCPPANNAAFRSVLATPLRLGGGPAGVLAVFARHPNEWTREQFMTLEWISAQCSLLMEAREMRMELQRSNETLDRLVRERTAELQELVNELEHFSYTITHDLRAPLRAMLGFAGLLAEEGVEKLNEESREYLMRITTAAGRMDRLITDALSYSKVVRNAIPMEAVEVGRLVRGIVESYPGFQEPNATIEVGELPDVMGNEAALTQSFSNLLGNAVKFVAPGTHPVIRVAGERRGGRVRLWCEDNGIGIAPEMQARVFVMFQRLSKNYEGTGIGLALVKKVVERMGGAVGVTSEPGKGSRFWIELNAVTEVARGEPKGLEEAK